MAEHDHRRGVTDEQRSMPACSANRAPGASYAVTITIFSPRLFTRRTRERQLPGCRRVGASLRVGCSLSSPSRTTLSIKRVEPTRAAAARSLTPSSSRSSTYSGSRPLSAPRVATTGSDPCWHVPSGRLRAPAAARARGVALRPRGRRCATTAPDRPRHGRSARREGRDRRSGRGSCGAGPQPAARPSGRSTRPAGRTMLNSFRQTVATPRKWPGRASPSAPACSTSTQVAYPSGYISSTDRREQDVDARCLRQLRVA